MKAGCTSDMGGHGTKDEKRGIVQGPLSRQKTLPVLERHDVTKKEYTESQGSRRPIPKSPVSR